MQEKIDERIMVCNPENTVHYTLLSVATIENARELIDDFNAKHIVKGEPLDLWFICSVDTRTRFADDGTFVSKEEYTTVLEKHPEGATA